MVEEDEGLEIKCTLCDYVLRTNVTLTLSIVKARD